MFEAGTPKRKYCSHSKVASSSWGKIFFQGTVNVANLKNLSWLFTIYYLTFERFHGERGRASIYTVHSPRNFFCSAWSPGLSQVAYGYIQRGQFCDPLCFPKCLTVGIQGSRLAHKAKGMQFLHHSWITGGAWQISFPRAHDDPWLICPARKESCR